MLWTEKVWEKYTVRQELGVTSAPYAIKRCFFFFSGYKIPKKSHKLIIACSSASSDTKLWKHIRGAGGPSFQSRFTALNTLTPQLRALQTQAMGQAWYGMRTWQTAKVMVCALCLARHCLLSWHRSSCHRPAAVETWAENNVFSTRWLVSGAHSKCTMSK